MDLSQLGGGGVSVTSFLSATIILAAGATGDIITLTPPVGKRVILNQLIPTGVESGITVNGSSQGNIVTSKTLAVVAQQVNTFCVGQSSNDATAINNAGWVSQIIGDIDEVITIKKDSGATSYAIHYSYAYGS